MNNPAVQRRPTFAPPPAIIWIMAAVMVGTELAFEAADRGLLPWARLRIEGYFYLGFIDMIFEAARDGAAVPTHFYTSFVTYAFLHGGAFHLIMNGVIFLSLGGILANMLGPIRFMILFAATAASGALVFGLITDTQGPLVGASGSIFGFFGAFKYWEWRYIQRTGAPYQRLWGTVAALILINVVLYFGYPGGALAWEAHLGGFIGGVLVAPLLAPRLAIPSPI